MSEIIKDEGGWPILLATQAPGQVAAQPASSGVSEASGATSGNPWKDPANGQFTNGPPGLRVFTGEQVLKTIINAAKKMIDAEVERTGADGIGAYQKGDDASIVLVKGDTRVSVFVVPTENSQQDLIDTFETQFGTPEENPLGPVSRLPQGVTQEQWDRRVESVRNAARALSVIDEEKAREFLEKTKADLTQVDLAAFVADVREARLDDLVDVLAGQTKNLVERAVPGGGVRVSASRGWVKSQLRNLTDDEVIRIVKRLEMRGFDPEEIKTHVISKIPDKKRRKKLEQLYGEGTPEPEPEPEVEPDDSGS